jgi:sortase A
MNRRLKRVIGYILIPVLFLILASGLFYVAGTGVLDIMVADIKYVIVKGSSTYNYSEELEENSAVTKGIIDKSEVKVPNVGTQYAVLVSNRFDSAIPIYYGDGKEELESGIGQYVGSYFPGEGKTILIGGHDTTFFKPLETVKKGDEITIKTSYGIFVYQVTKTEIHEAKDQTAYDLESDKEQLILYTCYPFGDILENRSERYFVYCDKLKGPTIKEGLDNE